MALTPAQMSIAREFVFEKAKDAGFVTGDSGPLEFLITQIVENTIPDFSTSAVSAFLDAKNDERLTQERAALVTRINEIDTELGK